jgi:predicted Zn finger-like uncharacterized protein
MRLGCPNCGALYEVADTALPASGRTVECSACGHRWFHHARAAAPAAGVASSPAAELDDPETGAPEPEPAGDAHEPATPPAGRVRQTDPAVLQILREEAAREMAARRREAARAAAPPASARQDPVADAPPPRRALLPELDEIEASANTEARQGGRIGIADYAARHPRLAGFAAGLALSLLLGFILVAVYARAAELAAALPALEDPLARFVAAVDRLRLTIRGEM